MEDAGGAAGGKSLTTAEILIAYLASCGEELVGADHRDSSDNKKEEMEDEEDVDRKQQKK